MVAVQNESDKKNRNTIKAILFDCDGTIVDSENAHFTAWRYAMQRQGSNLTLQEYYSYVGGSTETIASKLSETLKKDCADQILQDKYEHFLSFSLHKGLPPIQPTLDFIFKLAERKENYGFKLGLASAARMEEILLHLRHLGIEELFDVIVSGRDDLNEYIDAEGLNKPKPYIYIHASKKLNVSPRDCVVIEDSSSGVKAGVDAGCFTIAIPNSYSSCQDFSLANLKIETFAGMDV